MWSTSVTRSVARLRPLGGLALAAVLFTACTGGGASTPPPPKAAEPTRSVASSAASTPTAVMAKPAATTVPKPQPAAAGPRVLTLGFVPGEDAEAVFKRYEPMVAYLKSALAVEIKPFAGTDYSATVEAMKAKRLDAAHFGPFSYILAAEVAGARALVMPGLPDGTPNSYQSFIIANKKSGITKLEDLKGRSFAFVDPASTSGYLIPRSLLVKSGLDPDKDMKAMFAGGHDASALAINGGKVDAGAVASSLFQRMVDQKLVEEENLVIIAKSDPIPSSPVTVRNDIDPELRERLKEAYLRAHEHLPPDVIKALVGSEKNRYIVADDALYNPLRETAKILNLDLAKIE